MMSDSWNSVGTRDLGGLAHQRLAWGQWMRRRRGPSGPNSQARWSFWPSPRAWRGDSLVGTWKSGLAPHSGQLPGWVFDRTASQMVHLVFMVRRTVQRV